jgi:hypothetical protein
MHYYPKLNKTLGLLCLTWQVLSRKKLLLLLASIVLSSVFLGMAGCTQPTLTKPPTAPGKTATTPAKETKTSAQEPTGQQLRKPSIEVSLEPGAFSQGGWDVKIEVVVTNPNSGSVDLGNLLYTAKDGKGRIYVQDTVPGGPLAPKAKSTFTHNMVLPPDVFLGTGMLVAVETKAEIEGVTIPISCVTSAPNIRQLYAAPKMDLSFDLGMLYPHGFDSKLLIGINNYYPLRLNVGLLQMIMKGKTGNVVKTFNMEPGYVEPKSAGTFTNDVTIPATALNERQITLTADAMAGVERITMPLKSTSTINVPTLASLVSDLKSVSSISEYSWGKTYPLPEISFQIETIVSNNKGFDLALSDLKYLVYNYKGTLISEQSKPTGYVILNANETETITRGMFLAPEIAKLINTDITIKVQMEFEVEGVTEKVILSNSMVFALKPY